VVEEFYVTNPVPELNITLLRTTSVFINSMHMVEDLPNECKRDPHFSMWLFENNKIRNNRCETSEGNANGGGIFFRGEGRIVNNDILNNE